jgi:hypothetical protein
MIREEIKQLKTGPGELRKFGLLVGFVFLALGILFLLRHKTHYPWFLLPGIVLVFAGALAPRALRHVYIGWMSLAIVLGFVVSNVILTLFFFLVITPIAAIARLAGKDFLRLKLDRNAASYWIPRKSSSPKTKADYERQF